MRRTIGTICTIALGTATLAGCAGLAVGAGATDPDGQPVNPAYLQAVMEKVAEAVMPPAHFGYIQTGVDGEGTQRNNRAGFEDLYLGSNLPPVYAGDVPTGAFPTTVPLDKA